MSSKFLNGARVSFPMVSKVRRIFLAHSWRSHQRCSSSLPWVQTLRCKGQEDTDRRFIVLSLFADSPVSQRQSTCCSEGCGGAQTAYCVKRGRQADRKICLIDRTTKLNILLPKLSNHFIKLINALSQLRKKCPFACRPVLRCSNWVWQL